MIDTLTAPIRLNQQCRIVIPQEVRRALGIASGDQVVFQILGEGKVLITSPAAIRTSVWANNHGGDAGDSTIDVRGQRIADQRTDATSARSINADAGDEGPEITTQDLLSQLA